MNTTLLIHKHRKQIAVLKMIENADARFESLKKLINAGLNLKETTKKLQTIIAIQDRLINYYLSL
jgi:hypothetical protein